MQIPIDSQRQPEAKNCVLIDTGPGIQSLTRFMVAWA